MPYGNHGKAGRADSLAAIRIPAFRNLLFARFFVTLGVQMLNIIIQWHVYQITKDPLALGFIGLVEAVPSIGISLYAGFVADRNNRKIILRWCMVIILAGAASLSVMVNSFPSIINEYGALPIYVTLFIIGIARGFYGPAAFAILGQLIPRNLYANATTWQSANWHTASMIGPALGGLVYASFGVDNSYWITTAVLIIPVVLIELLPKLPVIRVNSESLKESLKQGIAFVFRRQIILAALSLDLFAVLFGGAVALLPVFANEILEVGPSGLGYLRASPAVGSIIMSLILSRNPPGKNAGRNLILSVAGFGLCMLFFALSRDFYLSIALLFFSGLLDNVSVVTRSTILQLYTPEEMRGRVASVNMIFIGSSNEIGAFESGAMARLMGLIPSVVFGGAMTMLVSAATAIASPKLRNLDLTQNSD